MEKSTDQELWPLQRGAVHPPSKEGARRMPPSSPPSPSDRQLLHWQPPPTGAGHVVSVRGAAWGEGASRSGGTNRRHGTLLTPSHRRLLLPLDGKHLWVHQSGGLPRMPLMREHPALGLAPCTRARWWRRGANQIKLEGARARERHAHSQLLK